VPGQEVPIPMGTMIIVDERLVDPVALIGGIGCVQVLHGCNRCLISHDHGITGAEIVNVLAHGPIFNNFDDLLATAGKGEQRTSTRQPQIFHKLAPGNEVVKIQMLLWAHGSLSWLKTFPFFLASHR
jgi:hypothetical protein